MRTIRVSKRARRRARAAPAPPYGSGAGQTRRRLLADVDRVVAAIDSGRQHA